MLESRDGRRVVVTGVGAVTPCGLGVQALWDGLHAVPADDVQRRVPPHDGEADLGARDARRADAVTRYTVRAAGEALDAAGLSAGLPDDVDPVRAGVVLGTGIGGVGTLEEQIVVRHERGPRRVSPFTIPATMANAPGAALAMRHGWRGPCETVSTACASGTHAVSAAARLVASGRCDVVLTGGCEAALTPTTVAAFTRMRALSGSGRSAPFSSGRDGFCLAEGAAVLVLEELDAARRRGAPVLAEVLGAASTSDAHHVTAPAPGGAGAQECVRLALADAGLAAGDVAHVNAHGTSTPLNDAAEAEALAAVFGLPGPPVTSVKGVTGHGLGLAGALEAVAVVLSLRAGALPPTAGTEVVDPALPAIDVVTRPRRWTPGPVVSTSFAFGGHNGALVLAPVV